MLLEERAPGTAATSSATGAGADPACVVTSTRTR